MAKYLLVPHKNWHRVKLVDTAVISFIMFVPAVLASGVILIALATFFNALDVKVPDSVILIMVAPVYPYPIFLVLSDTWKNGQDYSNKIIPVAESSDLLVDGSPSWHEQRSTG